MSYKIWKFVLDDILRQTLQISCIGIFSDLQTFVCIGTENINPDARILFYMIEHLIWMNITSYTYDQTHL
jgi:hypothetical protein